MKTPRQHIATTLLLAFGLCGMPSGSIAQEQHSARWLVKTLADRDTALVNFTPIESSVREQNALPKASVSGSTRRLASETQCYSITADLVALKRELDGDYHLVVRDIDTNLMMILELPNPELAEVKATSRAELYALAKRTIDSLTGGPPPLLLEKHLDKPIRFQFTGIGFYDTWHLIPQMGMPANNRELHPILTAIPIKTDD